MSDEFNKELIKSLMDAVKDYTAATSALKDIAKNVEGLTNKLNNGMKQEIIEKITEGLKTMLESITKEVQEENCKVISKFDVAIDKLDATLSLLTDRTAELGATDSDLLKAFNQVNTNLKLVQKNHEEFARAKVEAANEVRTHNYLIFKWIDGVLSGFGGALAITYAIIRIVYTVNGWM